MNVRVVGHGRTPGVQDGGDADPRAKMLRIGRDGPHRLGCRLEQQIVDQRLVVKGDGGDLGRQGEHDMEIAHRQQIRFPRFQPRSRRRALTLRTMPVTTAVVSDPPVPAVGAGFDVPAQRSGSAMLDRRHDLELVQTQVSGMDGPIGRPGSAEDVGDLEGGHTSAVGRFLCRQKQAELVERTGHGAHRAGCDPRIERGVLQLGMPEQRLDDPDVDTVFK